MFPTLSVTLIGLLVGGAIMLVTRRMDWMMLLIGLVGAWIGFVIGALFGAAVDVVFATGMWVALAGHVMALVGAAFAVRFQFARTPSQTR